MILARSFPVFVLFCNSSSHCKYGGLLRGYRSTVFFASFQDVFGKDAPILTSFIVLTQTTIRVSALPGLVLGHTRWIWIVRKYRKHFSPLDNKLRIKSQAWEYLSAFGTRPVSFFPFIFGCLGAYFRITYIVVWFSNIGPYILAEIGLIYFNCYLHVSQLIMI